MDSIAIAVVALARATQPAPPAPDPPEVAALRAKLREACEACIACGGDIVDGAPAEVLAAWLGGEEIGEPPGWGAWHLDPAWREEVSAERQDR